MLSHLNGSAHKSPSRIAIDTIAFYKAAQQCQATDVEPSHPPCGIPAVYGLKTVPGFHCIDCNYCSTTNKTMQKHTCSSKTPTTEECSVQHFNQAYNKTWFKIIPQSSLEISTNTTHRLIKDVVADFLSLKYYDPNNEDYRIEDQWLLTTKWHHFTRNTDTAVLQSAVVVDSRDVLYKTVRKVVYAYLDDCIGRLEDVSLNIRLRLNTNDPTQ